MIWGIVAALDEELRLIVDAMVTERKEKTYGVDFHIGTIGKTKVVAVCCSIGTINAAACASVLIREFGAEAVVNVGVAGSTCPELKILDVVLSSDVAFHDAQLEIIEKYYPFKSSFPADSDLLVLAQESIAAMNAEFRCKVGRIVSGDVFVSDPAVKQDIIDRCNPLCVEMEGAAIGQIAYMNGVPFLVIRTLSDNAGDGAEEHYDNFLERAAHNSANIILGMLRLAEEKEER